MKRFSIGVTVASVLIASAGAASATQRDRENIIAQLRQIQSQLNDIQNTNALLAQAIEELKSQSQNQQGDLRKTLADSNVALERLQQDLSILSARVDETNGRMGELQREVSSVRQSQQPLILPPDETDETGEDVDPDAPDAAVPPLLAGAPNLTDIYEQALTDYRQGRYPLAISGFQDVLETDRDGELADNAHYWIGESYLAQRRNDKAIESFDTVVRDYPNSNKRSDAYLKKGIALQNMDRKSEAMLIFELVISQFPRTQHERIARSRLEELMRTTPPR